MVGHIYFRPSSPENNEPSEKHKEFVMLVIQIEVKDATRAMLTKGFGSHYCYENPLCKWRSGGKVIFETPCVDKVIFKKVTKKFSS